MVGISSALVWAIVLNLCTSKANPQKIQKTFTLEELVPLQADFAPERVTVQFISDSEYIIADPRAIHKINAKTDIATQLLDEADMAKLAKYGVSSFSNDQKYVLLVTERKKVYRYSVLSKYSVYNLESKSIGKIGEGLLQVVMWDNGHSIAYVQNNNVFYVPNANDTDVVIPLTTDGIPGKVYYGVADWIYEEEIFNAAEAMWFSKNGSYLAVASFNDTLVESAVFPYYGDPNDFDNQYPEMITFKYPKAGRRNPNVELRVFKLKELDGEPMYIKAPVDVVGNDYILGRVNWASDNNVIVLWLNRRQSISVLMNCDLKNNACKVLKEQSEPNGWIDIREPLFDSNGTRMIEIQPQLYENQRYMHVTLFDFNTLETIDLTPGNSTVTDILGWDLDKDKVFFIASPGLEPWQRQLWSVYNGTIFCMTCAQAACHTVEGMFSPGGSFGVLACSAFNVPPVSYFYVAENNGFRLLTDNARLVEKLNEYKLPMVLYNKMPILDGVQAHIKLQLPPVMEDGRKYPMIVRVYSGPGTTRVKDNYDLEYYNKYLSGNRSFIVASIDVRGSGVMGVESMHALNKALGTAEITDTLETISHLLKTYSFIDPNRVGVWGWSYGGYATTMMLVQDDQKLLACGAAVAPVTSWLYYDSIYTERYMDTPQENLEGYQRADLMSKANKMRGRKFLIVHGTGDDNVHFQHSIQFAKELQRADIDFEQMTYADENHSLRGVSRHFYHTLDRFWSDCFNL
ncbi:venom dipeptidyl peptidase 4-like isoform X1 [Leptidea sinapis]|uniref:venom dipeptidyl peptidase 4-like isoform X1 n=2 Tax=Leptidea sinapis TaxID=189913 RepID=UPI00212FA9EF|nr:venom dipeptidyl peptidase 4-like isoform X1 [Leptidea sinapis]